MKSSLILSLIVALGGCASSHNTQSFSGCSVSVASQNRSLDNQLRSPHSPHVMVVAHRACWQEAPENSIAAIEACIRAGVDMVELDVRRTRDGRIVLIHDETVDRTTGTQGAVSDFTLTELTTLNLREGAGGPQAIVTDEKVPSFEEALRATGGKILVNVDAKEDVIDQAMTIVEQMGLGDEVLMKAVVDPDLIEEKIKSVRGISHFMPILWERDSTDPLSQRITEYLSVDPVAFEIVYNNRDYLIEGTSALDDANVRIWANTMLPRYSAGLADAQAIEDPAAVWGVLISDGADMIQTDRPIEAVSYLKSVGRRCD